MNYESNNIQYILHEEEENRLIVLDNVSKRNEHSRGERGGRGGLGA